MFRSIEVSGRPSRAEAVIIGHFKGERLDKQSAALDVGEAASAALSRKEATGEVGSIAEAYPGGDGVRVLVVGLGERASFTPGVLRTAAGSVGRRLSACGIGSATVELAGAVHAVKGDTGEAGKAFGEGLGLIGWTCDQFRGKATQAPERVTLRVGSSDRSFVSGLRRGLALAESANLCRTLSQTPPNICTPAYMAAQAQKLARATGMRCTVIRGPALERERLTGLINVGRASENKPCLIRLEYRPRGASDRAKPVVLLGKTMCYDSGGLSLKVNNGMKGMKRDKDGGCAVLGAMHAVATSVRPRFPVVGLLVAAENAVSDQAYRPDDVLTFRNGVTVEVTNTDAEGRLVLADGLCWACEKERPRCIVDLATLTGGVVVALGSVYAGLWCDDDRLRGLIERAAERSGERVWRLPHDPEYRAMMKSPIADIHNSAPVREAHPIQGAAFLSYFVEDGIPWAHIDIAGVHATDKDKGPFVPGPTGFGTRLLAELIDAM